MAMTVNYGRNYQRHETLQSGSLDPEGQLKTDCGVHQRLLGGTSLLDKCALTSASKDCGSIKTRALPLLLSRTQISGEGIQRP